MARKPAHASPAPSPNLLVKEEAIQSVDSAVFEVADLLGFCCCTGKGVLADCVLSGEGGDGDGGCEGRVGG